MIKGLDEGHFVKGRLRINAKNFEDCYIPGGKAFKRDINIPSFAARYCTIIAMEVFWAGVVYFCLNLVYHSALPVVHPYYRHFDVSNNCCDVSRRNRALDGDIVVAEILPRHTWRVMHSEAREAGTTHERHTKISIVNKACTYHGCLFVQEWRFLPIICSPSNRL